MKKIYFVPVGYLAECLELRDDGEKYALPNEMFIECEVGAYNAVYTACDNRDGDAWTEDFTSLSGAIEWLLETEV